MHSKDECIAAIVAMGVMHNKVLPDFITDLYDEIIDKIGNTAKVMSAIKEFATQNKLPSPRELSEACGQGSISDDFRAGMEAKMAYELISRAGYTGEERARERLQPTTYNCITQVWGSWDRFCGSVKNESEAGTFTAQLRQTLLGFYKAVQFGEKEDKPLQKINDEKKEGLESSADVSRRALPEEVRKLFLSEKTTDNVIACKHLLGKRSSGTVYCMKCKEEDLKVLMPQTTGEK